MPGFGFVIPRAGAGPIVTPWKAYASDNFAAPNGSLLNGRALNNALGGAAVKSWQVGAGSSALSLDDGRLHRNGGTTAAVGVVAMPQADYGIEAKVLALPVGATVGLFVRRTAITGGSDHRLSLGLTGSASLLVTGANPASFDYAPGDVLGIRVKGTLIEALKNGVVMATATATLTEAGSAGFAVGGGTTDYSLDNAILSVPA